MPTLWYSSMVLVFLNSPEILTSTGPAWTSSVMSAKLKASTERMESFYGLLERRYLATSFLDYESSLYY